MNRTKGPFLAAFLLISTVSLTPFLAAAEALTGKESNQELWGALLQRGGVTNTQVRRDFHRELASARRDPQRTYPDNPLADLKKIEDPLPLLGGYPSLKSPESTPMKSPAVGFWEAAAPAAEGRDATRYYLWAPPQYDASKEWPLIVILHGGGSGPGSAWAAHYLALYSNWYGDKPYIVVAVPAPVNKSPWFQKANVEAVLDAMADVCRRFNIDRKRMYLNGHSLGGWGVTDFAWAAPDLFAAYAPETCATALPNPAPDLKGTAFILFNCGGEKFAKRLRDAGADAAAYDIPSAHSIPHEKTKPKMFEFFDNHVNNCAPDLELARQLLLERVQ